MINKTILTIMAAATAVAANALPVKWGTTDAQLSRQGEYLSVGLTLDLKGTDVPSDRAVLLTPCLVTDTDTVELPSVGIYGRNRYLYYQRRSSGMISGQGETVIKNSDRPDTLAYRQMVPYADALNDSRLIVKYTSYGCCAKPIDHMTVTTGAEYREFVPWRISPVYVAASAVSEKTDSLADKAYINFVVNRTEIKPDYRENYAELAKIRRSIDMVIQDPDCTITGIWLKGYASPEGKYAHNADLAYGRTQSLKEYIRNLYSFPAAILAADSQPEDWEGLKQSVAQSNLDNRDAILDIISSDIAPDDKEALIKKRYPADYAFLLEHVYPSLRHTDYRIDYTIRRFTDVDEIRRVFETQPRKLDLNELYLLASHCQPGSAEFNAVYETAARMYPDDVTANLNAANAAMQSGNLQAAAQCLERAGDSIEAQYSRGMLALLNGDYTTAQTLLRAASEAGIDGADDLLRQMEYNRVIDR